MKRKGLLVACCVLVSAGSIGAQSPAAADPISGTWTGEPPNVAFELKFDGKSTVSGTVTPQPGQMTKGTFDAKTGALKLDHMIQPRMNSGG